MRRRVQPTMNKTGLDLPVFQAPFAPPDEDLAASFLPDAARDAAAERPDRRARAPRWSRRSAPRPAGSAASRTCCALFALHQGGAGADGAGRSAAARAGRRDRRPADRGQARRRATWLDSDVKSTAFLVIASAWALGVVGARHPSRRDAGEASSHGWRSRLGLPAVRAATRQAMRLMGTHFVLGQTIEEALARAGHARRVPLFLRHAGRGRAHRGRRRALFRGLRRRDRGDRRAPPATRRCRDRPGISVKLSALHPRYEAVSRERVMARTGAAR